MPGNVSIVEISPANIQMKFDSLQTLTLDIRARLTGYSVPEDEYLIRDVTVSPRSVELTGPAEEIERTASALSEEEINESYQLLHHHPPLKFPDADGNELQLEYTIQLTSPRPGSPCRF